MLFRRKKKEKQNLNPPAHRIFQIGAILLIGFVVYTLYFSPVSTPPGAAQKCEVDKIKVENEVKAALQRLTVNTEYKRIKEFAATIDAAGVSSLGILNVPQGVMVFIPSKMADDGSNELLVENKNYKVTISVEKLSSDSADSEDFIGPREK